jgi:hypothetical protein
LWIKGEHHLEFRCCTRRICALVTKPDIRPRIIIKSDDTVSPVYLALYSESSSDPTAERVREVLRDDPELRRCENIYTQRMQPRVIYSESCNEAVVSQFKGRLFWLECFSSPIDIPAICNSAKLLRVLILDNVTISCSDVELLTRTRLPLSTLGKDTWTRLYYIFLLFLFLSSPERFSRRRWKGYETFGYGNGREFRPVVVFMVGEQLFSIGRRRLLEIVNR